MPKTAHCECHQALRLQHSDNNPEDSGTTGRPGITVSAVRYFLSQFAMLLIFPLRSILLWLILRVIQFYRMFISPLLGPHCRFEPSCSAYLHEALCTHGLFYGSWLGLKRLCRCHPWGACGEDPVPPRCTDEN